MANEALDHTVKLTVKKKKYTLTLSFNGLTINGQKGYLGWLKYYKVGYQTDAYGGPVGSPKAVDVTKNRMAPIIRKKFLFTMIAEAKKTAMFRSRYLFRSWMPSPPEAVPRMFI